MKYKTAREVYRDAELKNKVINEEEEVGCEYNYIIANHYSLENYLEENNISYDDALNINVACRVNIFKDPVKAHLQDKVKIKGSMVTSQVCKDKLYYKDTEHELIFRHGERRSVPLLYLIVKTFSLYQEIIFQTRMYEDQSDKRSSHSLKARPNETLLNDHIEKFINASLFCKSNVFLQPIINMDGTEVSWYIPIEDTEQNKRNAQKMYSNQLKISDESKQGNKYDIVFDDDNMSDEEIKSMILGKEKPAPKKRTYKKRAKKALTSHSSEDS